MYEREQKKVSRTMSLENQDTESDNTHDAVELAYFQFKNEKRLWDD